MYQTGIIFQIMVGYGLLLSIILSFTHISAEGWLYYERGTSNPWVYFDYNSQQWEEWFNEKPF